MKALVIGSNGMLGRALVKRLHEREWEVIEQGRSGLFDLNGEYDKNWRGWIKFMSPDVVFLTAAKTHVNACEDDYESWRINVWSPILIAQICEELGIKFVFISSFYVFDGKRDFYPWWNEVNSTKKPLNSYGLQKSMVENYLSRRNMNYLIFRSSAIFSYDDPKRMNILWQVMRGDKEFDDIHKFNPLSARAFAHVIVREVEKDTCGIIQVGCSLVFTKYSFAQTVYDVLMWDKSILQRQEKFDGSVKRPVDGCMVVDGEHVIDIRDDLLNELRLFKQDEEVELLHNTS